MKDLIERRAAIERATQCHDFYKGATIPTDKARRDELLNVMCWLGELPSAQPEYTEQDMRNQFNAGYTCGMEAAQPERKRGKWIEDDDGWDGIIWRCSECDAVFALTDGTPEENEYNYCPHCGAKMEVDDGSD